MVGYKRFCVVLLFLLVPVFLTAQTAAELENLLEEPRVSYAQAAWFVAGAAGIGDPEDAFDWAMSNRWLPKKAAPDDPITLDALSFLMMSAFNMRGGMMYSFFPGPRYAYRTMLSRGFIQGSADPFMTLSGERFLLILGNVLNSGFVQ